MLTCKQISELSSKKLDCSIPWFIRLQIKMHLLICKTCAQYEKHIKFIHHISRTIDKHYQEHSLSKEATQRINKKLKRLILTKNK